MRCLAASSLPRASALAISRMPQAGDAFARIANVRVRGQISTAARWYHRSTVLPTLPYRAGFATARSLSVCDVEDLGAAGGSVKERDSRGALRLLPRAGTRADIALP